MDNDEFRDEVASVLDCTGVDNDELLAELRRVVHAKVDEDSIHKEWREKLRDALNLSWDTRDEQIYAELRRLKALDAKRRGQLTPDDLQRDIDMLHASQAVGRTKE